jgi:hypothetical protein
MSSVLGKSVAAAKSLRRLAALAAIGLAITVNVPANEPQIAADANIALAFALSASVHFAIFRYGDFSTET